MLKILNRSVGHYLEHLRIINMISEQLERKLNQAMENRYLINMFTLEKSLVYYLNAITANVMVIDKLKASAVKLGFTTDESEALEDLIIENHQCAKQAEIHSHVLGGLLSAHASIISNNLNVMMKNLNAMVIAITVPSFIAGVGGMSEFSMMVGAENWPVAYTIFICLNILFGIAIYRFIRRWEHRR
ncbi:MAG TPA: magnesium transporter CorA family protein [bacterium]|nr:magnesium transporter CorA family protein [bacterium]